MILARIANSTRALGAPSDWNEKTDGICEVLSIRDIRLPGGNLPAMESAWEPTPEEIQAIVAGAPIILRVCGSTHPPVAVYVGDPPTPHQDRLI